MIYINSALFERAVLECGREEEDLYEKYGEGEWNFSSDVFDFLDSLHLSNYPNTEIGRSLYFGLKTRLERTGINTSGLRLLSTVGTSLDLRYYMDAIIHLPALPLCPITIDLFNLGDYKVSGLKNLWIRDSDSFVYSDFQFQSDLFQYKNGLRRWKKMTEQAEEFGFYLVLKDADFRKLVTKRRPENHFILTPYHTECRERRRQFTSLVAEYFINAIRKNSKNGLKEPPNPVR